MVIQSRMHSYREIVYTLEIGNPNLMTIKHAWIVRKNTEKYKALSLYPISPPTHIVDV